MELPTGVAALRDELISLGYRTCREEGSDWPSAAVDLEAPPGHEPRLIRLSHDRGVWDVEVVVQGELYQVFAALLALRGQADQQRALSNEERRDATLAFVREFDGSSRQADAIRTRADELRAAWTKRATGKH